MADAPAGRSPWSRLRKAFAPKTPQAIDDALGAEGMDTVGWMSPGRPLNPVEGYSQRPRAMDYAVASNVAIDSRSMWARTSFETLDALVDGYDVARMCINHKIDELKSMELMFLPLDGGKGIDIDLAVAAGRAALEFPDRTNPYDEWLAMLLENALRYDATPLYHRRNLNGDIIGLEILHGPTIAPYIDEHGRRPHAPAPAFFQKIKGQVGVWLTADDIVYPRFRPQVNSPYGLAPMESILLTANTDIRFQWHFLQMFTDGSVPAGFMEVPPSATTPDQVAEWQDYWDAMVLGDQAKLRQLIAVPSGTKVSETRPKAFDKAFPEYLMARTCAAYGVVPQDLGLTADVNRANGETQVDIQFRVNTLPWVRWVEGILSRYLRYGLGLPVKVALDTGRDKEDRLAEAQAWDTAVKGGAVSVDEWRTEVYGLPVDDERPMPRFIFSPRTGPVPLSSVLAIAGKINPETAAPADDAPLPLAPFDGTPGVLADKAPGGSQFKRAPINPDEPEFPTLEHEVPGSDVVGTKPAAPVIGDPGVPVVKPLPATDVTKAAGDELAVFDRFVKARVKAGRWRDFGFETLDQVTAHRLNDHGRASVRKVAGEFVAAGLAVQAADTGRVLMLQRALDEDDAAGGRWEFPGGHIEDGEIPFDAAVREWSEETGLVLPAGAAAGGWTASNSLYQGFVWSVASEDVLPIISDRDLTANPDDPDGDMVEAIAWWDPSLLPGNPAVRDELATDMDAVQGALVAGDVLKASRWQAHPVRHVEDQLAVAHAGALQAAIASTLTREQARDLAARFMAANHGE